MLKFLFDAPPCPLRVVVDTTDEGYVASVTGGDVPHVGAVALALPRPSLARPGQLSADTSVLTLPGHKEDAVAKWAAAHMCQRLGVPVVVVVGVHVGPKGVYNCTPQEIDAIVEHIEQAVVYVTKRLSHP